MNDTPLPFEQEQITPKHKDIKLSKLRRIRDRALTPGEEYVRKNELVRIRETDSFNGRQIPLVSRSRQDVVKSYEPEAPNNRWLKYIVRVGNLKYVQVCKLVRRLVDRTTRIRRVLAGNHKFTPKQVEILNHQFLTMAKQLEIAATDMKGRNRANA
jgi:hypothetical protein